MNTENQVAIPQINIGDTAPQFVVSLARMNPQLAGLNFTIYSPLLGAQDRLSNSLNRSASEIVSTFLHHDYSLNKHWQVSASCLSTEAINEKIASLPPNLALGLESRCTLKDLSVGFIPMMDFKPAPNEENLELLRQFLERLAYRGIIVDSGASYHFYGFDLLDYSKWIRFMGDCLLVTWSDSRWIGHSLIAGGGDLRISATAGKLKVPTVCAVLR